ncbi:MAG: universal stress protein [Bryobacteraceae bacterium]|nr:universal stress protein [Bryobacteraceae bacterium]
MIAPLFRRVVVAHSGPTLDFGLLDYAALLSSLQAPASVQVLAAPIRGALQSLGTAIRRVFAARGVHSVSPRLLAEPDLDEVFSAAKEQEADLLVVKHPRELPDGRAVAARLLRQATCSVCYVPERGADGIGRPLAAIKLEPQGSQLLEFAARLSSAARAEELIAMHTCFRDTLYGGSEADERFRQENVLEMYRFVARANLYGAPATPVVEENTRYETAMLKVARERNADLLLVGASDPPLLARDWGAEQLLWQCQAPLIQAVLHPRKSPSLWKRVFSQPEPAFN